jgi:hypothetical protein
MGEERSFVPPSSIKHQLIENEERTQRSHSLLDRPKMKNVMLDDTDHQLKNNRNLD